MIDIVEEVEVGILISGKVLEVLSETVDEVEEEVKKVAIVALSFSVSIVGVVVVSAKAFCQVSFVSASKL